MPGLMAVCISVWSRSTIKASLRSFSNRSWSCLANCSASCTPTAFKQNINYLHTIQWEILVQNLIW